MSRPQRRAAESGRRRQVEACLARWQLVHRPHPLPAGGGRAGEAAFGARLRGACEELGPVFRSFARSLASRVDLLPASDCLALAATADWVRPLPSTAVREQIVAELGGRGGKAFVSFEPEPFESRLFAQSHRARLVGGAPVIVRVARPGMTEAEELDLELLPFLAERLAGQEIPLDGAVSGFLQDLKPGADLMNAAQALELLAGDAATFGRLTAPAVHRDLTTSLVLTHADLEGAALAADGTSAVAAQLSVVWLRQALLGRVVPLDLTADSVRIVTGGRIGFQCRHFARLPAAIQPDLRALLIAVVSREPDEACRALLRQLVPEARALPESELLLHLRQIVPFRDGAWSPSGESLAEHAFVYLRTARACGYRPSQPMLTFYRGLFSAAAAVRDIAPAGDPLADGLQELRVLVSLEQMRDAIRPDQWQGQLDRYAVLMTTLPQKMDALLTLVAEEEAGRQAPMAPQGRPQRSAEASHLLLASLLMVLAAVALLLHNLIEAGVIAGPGEKAGAALLLAVGGLVLWALGRGGG